MQRGQTDGGHERVVAGDAREVDNGNARELDVREAGPAHQHQQADRQGAHPCVEQSEPEGEGQDQRERREQDRFQTRLGQAQS